MQKKMLSDEHPAVLLSSAAQWCVLGAGRQTEHMSLCKAEYYGKPDGQQLFAPTLQNYGNFINTSKLWCAGVKCAKVCKLHSAVTWEFGMCEMSFMRTLRCCNTLHSIIP